MQIDYNPKKMPESQILRKRILSFGQACQISFQARKIKKTIVFTSGCWDILHSAHLHYLLYLRRRGDLLIVGVDSDRGVQRIKGEAHPFFHEVERAMTVVGLRFVDYVFIFDGVWEVEHLIRLNPHYVGVPSFDPNMANKLQKIRLTNSQVIVTPPFLSNNSSSKKARLVQNDYLVDNVLHEVED